MFAKRNWIHKIWIMVSIFCVLTIIPSSVYAGATAPTSVAEQSYQDEATGSISGYVYQSDGITPISGANVTAKQNDFAFAGSHSSVSAVDGSYTISGLSPLTYQVYAEATGYIREFYNGTIYSKQAVPVNVISANNTSNISFNLDIGGSISGHIYQTDGITPISEVTVNAYSEEIGWGNYPIKSSSDGSYTITGVPTGGFHVIASVNGYVPKYYDGVYISDQAATVNVTAPFDTPGIDLRLDTGGSISGHIYQKDGVTPIAGASVYAIDVSVNDLKYTNSALDGTYTITGLTTASYYVNVLLIGFIPEFYDNADSMMQATPVNVVAPADTGGIDFTLCPSGSISGHIYQADGITPIYGALIQATLPDGTSSSEQSTVDGRYQIHRAPAGNNLVFVQAPGYVSEYFDNAYDPDHATLVPVTVSTDTPDINFCLDQGGLISGHVFLPDGTTPVPGATISAIDGNNRIWQNTSNVTGGYTTPYLPPGDYKIKAEAAGYITEYFSGIRNAESATLVTVSVSGNTASIDFTIDPVVVTPPVVTTDNATNITSSSATLYGTLDSLGSASSVNMSFQYGLSSAGYTFETTPEILSNPGTFNVNLSGLGANTVYYYRAKAVGAGTGYGMEKTFTTSSSPPPPTTPPNSNGSGGGFVGGGGGGSVPSGPGVISLSLYTGLGGQFNLSAAVQSGDGGVNLDIAKGVLALDKDGQPLKNIRIVPLDSPPQPAPSNGRFIGPVYELSPDKATFQPAITLTLSYDPADLPGNIDPNSLQILVYNPTTSVWEPIVGTVNRTASSVSINIEHFSIYAIVGKTISTTTTEPAPVLTPAQFTVSDLTLNPVSVLSGQTVSISTKVSNTGGTGGDYEVVLKINGIVESTKSVAVAAGTNSIVTFTTTRNDPGDYTVNINGTSSSFTIQQITPSTTSPQFIIGEIPPEPSRSLSWPVILLVVVGAIIVVGLGIFLFIRRRK
jgi:hypothetical protein